MSDQWHYSKAGKQHGPVSEDQLKHLAASGQLQRSDMVWREGMDQWAPASTVPGLFVAQGHPTPPPLPPAASSKAKAIQATVADQLRQAGQRAKDFAQSEQVQSVVGQVKAKWQGLSRRGKAITVGTATFAFLFVGWLMLGGSGQESGSRATRAITDVDTVESSTQWSEGSGGFHWERPGDQATTADSQRHRRGRAMESAGSDLGKGRVADDKIEVFVQKAIEIGCNAGGAAPVRWYRDPNSQDPERWWLSVTGGAPYKKWIAAFGERRNVRDFWHGTTKEEIWEHEFNGMTVVVVGKESHYSTFTPNGPVPDWETATISVLGVSFDD